MKNVLILLFTCVCALAQAQVNFVKNPGFEEFSQCPDNANQIKYANYWTDAIDTLSPIDSNKTTDYFNECADTGIYHATSIPVNNSFYQYSHTGSGIAGAAFFYDKLSPPPLSDDTNFRQYIQGRLITTLTAGKTYCLGFWVNLAEGSGYAQNKIGAYLDNGAINRLPIPTCTEILTVTPQLYTDDIITDTANWVKIEGSFVATGNETHITIGNFFTNSSTSVVPTNYWLLTDQISYYLIDDVSVIPIDLDADAGSDTWVEEGKQRQIGRVGDTTAMGLDCKWYHKGTLIDSGATITVNANAVKGVVDTYIVVQTICGIVKRDTVLVKTVGLGIPEYGFGDRFSVFPNPSNGSFTISAANGANNSINATVYDLLGRRLFHQLLSFTNKQAALTLALPAGSYLLELRDPAGNAQRERIVIQ